MAEGFGKFLQDRPEISSVFITHYAADGFVTLSALNLCAAKNRIFPKNPVFLYTSDHKIKVDKALSILCKNNPSVYLCLNSNFYSNIGLRFANPICL